MRFIAVSHPKVIRFSIKSFAVAGFKSALKRIAQPWPSSANSSINSACVGTTVATACAVVSPKLEAVEAPVRARFVTSPSLCCGMPETAEALVRFGGTSPFLSGVAALHGMLIRIKALVIRRKKVNNFIS